MSIISHKAIDHVSIMKKGEVILFIILTIILIILSYTFLLLMDEHATILLSGLVFLLLIYDIFLLVNLFIRFMKPPTQ